MLLLLKEEHKADVGVLTAQPAHVVQDFCKLAAGYLKKGPNVKLYQCAAQRLDMTHEVIRSAVEGLVSLVVESCRHRLSPGDFRDSVLALGFSEEHQQVLSQLYVDRKEEVSSVLSCWRAAMPHYRALDWRFEVQVASRALKQQVKPLVTLKLSLEQRGKDPGCSRSQSPLVHHHLLQTDPVNLSHMVQVLEAALVQAGSQHCRRIQRTIT